MTDQLKPSNSNLKFSDVMGGKDRELAEEAVRKDIQLLERAGVAHTVIADTLFTFLKAAAAPPRTVQDGAYAAWYLQLQRFRNDLQAEIDAIEKLMEDDRH